MNKFTASAPARANLIGEHTDYATNQGHVLPTPLPFRTTAAVQEIAGAPGQLSILSENYGNQPFERKSDDQPRHHWTDYVVGSVQAMAKKTALPSLEIKIKSDIPIGSGISSSAALCVAVVRALKGLTGTELTDEEIALMAQSAEHDFVGVPCGKMDQFVSSIGRPRQALLLNTKTLTYRHYPLAVTFCDHAGRLRQRGASSPKAAATAARGGMQRQARDLLGVGTLCELGHKDLDRLSALPTHRPPRPPCGHRKSPGAGIRYRARKGQCPKSRPHPRRRPHAPRKP